MSSACPCIYHASPFSSSYPMWSKDGDNIKTFNKHGYLVVKQLLTKEEVECTKSQISIVIKEWYERFNTNGRMEGFEHEEIVNRLPSVKSGVQSCQDPELEVRKLYRLAANFEFFANQCRHPSIVTIINQLLGNDIKLIQSMALLKPPGSGEKIWHQDNAYFRLTPPKVIGCWIALDPASCSNGCMHVLPSSHGSGLFEHGMPREDIDTFIDYGMIKQPNPSDVIPVILDPGDALVFHGETAHYTPPNVSQLRRRSVQYHYASSECRVIQCPRDEEAIKEQTTIKPSNYYFDCDPSCQEPKYFHYKKGEVLVCGKEYGDGYI